MRVQATAFDIYSAKRCGRTATGATIWKISESSKKAAARPKEISRPREAIIYRCKITERHFNLNTRQKLNDFVFAVGC
jgi:hypothetical protein